MKRNDLSDPSFVSIEIEDDFKTTEIEDDFIEIEHSISDERTMGESCPPEVEMISPPSVAASPYPIASEVSEKLPHPAEAKNIPTPEKPKNTSCLDGMMSCFQTLFRRRRVLQASEIIQSDILQAKAK